MDVATATFILTADCQIITSSVSVSAWPRVCKALLLSKKTHLRLHRLQLLTFRQRQGRGLSTLITKFSAPAGSRVHGLHAAARRRAGSQMDASALRIHCGTSQNTPLCNSLMSHMLAGDIGWYCVNTGNSVTDTFFCVCYGQGTSGACSSGTMGRLSCGCPQTPSTIPTA
jgi:hypothetical protein